MNPAWPVKDIIPPAGTIDFPRLPGTKAISGRAAVPVRRGLGGRVIPLPTLGTPPRCPQHWRPGVCKREPGVQLSHQPEYDVLNVSAIPLDVHQTPRPSPGVPRGKSVPPPHAAKLTRRPPSRLAFVPSSKKNAQVRGSVGHVEASLSVATTRGQAVLRRARRGRDGQQGHGLLAHSSGKARQFVTQDWRDGPA
jgi:hypothetical protein